VDHLESSTFWQVPVGSHDVQLNSQGLPSVQNLSNHPLSMTKLENMTKLHCCDCSRHHKFLWDCLVTTEACRQSSIVIYCCISSKGQASYEMEIVTGAENALLRWRHSEGRFCYFRWYNLSQWPTWCTNFLIYLLQSSTRTCFEQHLTHLQEVRLY